MRSQTQSGTLHHLKDSDLALADPRADIRDRQVIDAEGNEIGKVEDLLIDDRERMVRFLEVGSGGFLGIGETTFLLPVEAVTKVDEDSVRVNQRRDRVAGAPKYDPDLVERTYRSGLYQYYGYRTPYLDGGYVYPRYPYF